MRVAFSRVFPMFSMLTRFRVRASRRRTKVGSGRLGGLIRLMSSLSIFMLRPMHALALVCAMLSYVAQAAGELELGKLEKLTSAQVQIAASQKSIDVGKREARWQLKFS